MCTSWWQKDEQRRKEEREEERKGVLRVTSYFYDIL